MRLQALLRWLRWWCWLHFLVGVMCAEDALVVWTPTIAAVPMQEKLRVFQLSSGAVHVEQRWGEQLSTGASQWAGGQALANFLERSPELWRGARCVELGAGGGGLVAVALLRAGAASVVAI